MINKFIDRVMASNNRFLFEGKQKIKELSKKPIGEISNKLPTPNSLIVKLNSLNISNPEDLLKAESYYNNTINIVDNTINKISGRVEELESINVRFKNILSNFEQINEIIDTIEPFVKAIRILLPTLDLILASQNPLTGINGLTLKKTMDKVDDLKDKIEKILDIIITIPTFLETFTSESEKFTKTIDSTLDNLNEYIQKLKDLRAQMVLIYQEYISKFVFPTLNDELLGTSQTPEQFVVDNIEKLPTLISNITTIYYSEYKEGNTVVGYDIKKQ